MLTSEPMFCYHYLSECSIYIFNHAQTKSRSHQMLKKKTELGSVDVCMFLFNKSLRQYCRTNTNAYTLVYVYLFISFVPSFDIHILYVCYVEMDKHALPHHTTPYIYMYYHFPVDEQSRRWLNFPYTFFFLHFYGVHIYIYTRKSERSGRQQATKRERSSEKEK